MNSIFVRRSIREYDSRPVEPEKLDRILRAGMQAPSAMNRQPWEFLIVTRPDKIQEIAALTPYGKPASRAPMVLVPLVNLSAAGENNRFWVQDLPVCKISFFKRLKRVWAAVGWVFTPTKNAPRRCMMLWICPTRSFPSPSFPSDMGYRKIALLTAFCQKRFTMKSIKTMRPGSF